MDEISLFQVVLSLAVVLGGIWGLGKGLVLWRQKTPFRKSNAAKRLTLVENLFLDTQHRLVVVRWDEEEHLVLIGSKDDKVLSTKKMENVKPVQSVA